MGDNHKGEITYQATEALAEGSVVKLSDATSVELCSATDANAIGVAIDTTESGDYAAIRLFGISKETAIGIASAAISAGDLVVLGADGKLKALPTTAGTYYGVGIALTDAYADGNEVEFAHRQAQTITVTS